MSRIVIKALGQTIKHKGSVILVAEEMPVNCMVLFVDMATWKAIKDDVKLHNEDKEVK